MRSDPGEGFGEGSGYGYGFGFSEGSGYGFGFGSGEGSGEGSGSGCEGWGDTVGEIDEYNVIHLTPWPYVKVGCQVHSIKHWRKHWRKIAKENNVAIDEQQVEKLLKNIGETQ